MSKEMIVTATGLESRLAVLEKGQVIQLFIEDKNDQGILGNIYKGKVTRVLPGMQAAFVDIGLDRNAFLYVADVFDDYGEYEEIVESADATAEPIVVDEEEASERPRRGRRRRRRRRRPQAEAASPSEIVAELPDWDPEILPERLPYHGQAGEGEDEADPPGEPDQILPNRFDVELPDSSRRRRRGRSARLKFDPDIHHLAAPDDKESGDSGKGGKSRSRSRGRGRGRGRGRARGRGAADQADEDSQEGSSGLGELLPGEELAARSAPPPKTDDAKSPPPGKGRSRSRSRARARTTDETRAPEAKHAKTKPETDRKAKPKPKPKPRAEPKSKAGTRSRSKAETKTKTESRDKAEAKGRAKGGKKGQSEKKSRSRAKSAEKGGRATKSAGRKEKATGKARAKPGTTRRRTGRRNRNAEEGPRIGDLLKEGQEVLVQVAKEPIGRKGARITSHIVLPGRYVVFMPTVDHVGVSRRIPSAKERQRLRDVVTELRGGIPRGFIVRTAGEGRSEEDLRQDMVYLNRLWEQVRAEADRAPRAPAAIHQELDLVLRVIRDQFTSDFRALLVDDEAEYNRIVEFINNFNPSLAKKVKRYRKKRPIFDEYGVNAEIEKGLRSKVWLKNGGYLVINQTEALVSIDINTGKYVGSGTSLEETITKTNVDAVKEIVRQLRFRDLGGIIVIDFIDMAEASNRRKVLDALQAELDKDKAPSKMLPFNEFGLVAITRKRSKQSLQRTLCQPCEYCGGDGFTRSVRTICLSIYEDIRRLKPNLAKGKSLLIRCHPDVSKAFKTGEKAVMAAVRELAQRKIRIQGDGRLHVENFDIVEEEARGGREKRN